MLSDEEKEAIEILGEFKKNGFHLLNLKYESRVSTTKHIENSIEIILNLIEKQSKEIEELKNKNKKLQDKAKELIFEKQELTSALLDSTPNDKIKATIEELDENGYWDFLEKRDEEKCKDILQSLLEKE